MLSFDYMTTRRTRNLGLQERLAEALVEGAFLTKEQMEAAMEEARSSGVKLSEVLVEKQYISPETVSTVLSFQFNVPVVDLRQFKVQPEAISLLPENLAKERNVLALSLDGDSLRVAVEDPQDVALLDQLASVTGKRIKPVLPLRGGLKELIDSSYKSTTKVAAQLKVAARPTAVEERVLEPDAVARAPVVQAVETIITQAVKDRSPDIHIIPTAEDLKVFYRIDGVLHPAVSLPTGVHSALASRIKVLANMNIAERRRPQDGQFTMKIDGRDINFRVATADTHHGEMLVLRILDKTISLVGLAQLGFQPDGLQVFQGLLKSPFGMIMVSGPTGSGKTTTLYAALSELVGKGHNIMTVEDPIEYQLEGVNQIQVNRQADITFSVGLRAIMRLDPDVILVGEIRDAETANTAIQAALTGHLVLTTIHANDSAAAIVRLVDMGIEPFLVTSAVVGSVAQRLLRRVCSYCRTPYTPPEAEVIAFQRETGETTGAFYTGRGCNFCSHTGFQGRVGVFEVLPVTEAIRTLVVKQSPANEIRAQAVKEGMISMRRDGMLKAREGVTTPAEVIRSVFTIA